MLRAREREADERELIGIAARAFNRSPHLERVREMVSRHGRPKVALGVHGIELPRRVFITFTFGGESRTFIVSLDLVARTRQRRPRLLGRALRGDGPPGALEPRGRHRALGVATVQARMPRRSRPALGCCSSRRRRAPNSDPPGRRPAAMRSSAIASAAAAGVVASLRARSSTSRVVSPMRRTSRSARTGS